MVSYLKVCFIINLFKVFSFDRQIYHIGNLLWLFLLFSYPVFFQLAVWQQNLSAVHEIWKDYIQNYSLNIIFLRKFIWSFTRLKDLKSAYETLQHMVALAINGRLFVIRTGKGRLYSSRLDIPIPSKGELGSPKVKLGENEQSLALKFGTDASNIEKSKSVSATVGMPNNYKILPVMKVLRWSFSDLLHACAQARDYELAEELMVLVGQLFFYPELLVFCAIVIISDLRTIILV